MKSLTPASGFGLLLISFLTLFATGDECFAQSQEAVQNTLRDQNVGKAEQEKQDSEVSTKKESKKSLKYHTYQSMLEEIREHEKKNPKICKIHDLGASSDGETHMWALKISDNVDKEEDEPTVLLTGAIHGNERPAPEMALYTINQLLSNPAHKKLIDSTQIWVIPIMNTAGHVANTRQNANRKDLNRGFPKDWKDDSLDGLEIETKNLIKNFYRKRAHVVAGIDLHTFGEVYLMPYACRREDPADFAAMSVLAQRMSQSAGYRPMKLTRFIRRTVKGGGADYRYGKYGTFYYGLELGRSHHPPEKSLQKLFERNLAGVLMMMNRVHHSTLTGHVTKNGQPVIATVTVDEIDGPNIIRRPYRSDKKFGRYYRILLPGEYKVTFESDKRKIVKRVKITSAKQTKLNVNF